MSAFRVEGRRPHGRRRLARRAAAAPPGPEVPLADLIAAGTATEVADAPTSEVLREDPSPTQEIAPVADPPASFVPTGRAPVDDTATHEFGTGTGTGAASAEGADGDEVVPAVAATRRTKPRRTPFWVLIWRTLKKAWGDRILGLAAEAGFWQLLSLPPLLLAVFGTLGYFGDAFGANVAGRIEDSLVKASSHILTATTVTDSVQPTIEEVLRNGRPDVISLGFLISLWSGSTAMATYVNTITIAYGERDARNALRSRLLALRLYLAQVLTGVVLLPALVLGPTVIDRLLDKRVDRWARHLVTYTYWPLVALLSLTILTSLYHLSVPHRRPWRRAVPGAVLAMVIWLVGCYGLRLYVAAVFDRAVVYGTLAAPVAVLLFFYITAFAVLLGAEFNATLDQNRRSREVPSRVH